MKFEKSGLKSDLAIAETQKDAVDFAVNHFLKAASKAIDAQGHFTVALSGGSTPNAIYRELAKPTHIGEIDWSRVFIFWSDERSVGIDHPDNNYRTAMEAGLKDLPIPKHQIHRMVAETLIEANAAVYEKLIQKVVPGSVFDYVMLGMGDDGHTASLFPHTEALREQQRLVVANYVPQKNTWRMTFTYKLLNQAKLTVAYVLGAAKAEMLKKVLKGPHLPQEYPIQAVGSQEHPLLWILDNDVAQFL